MHRPSASRLRALGLALAVSVAAGVGLSACELKSASEAATPRVPRAASTATDSSTAGSAPAEALASPLTLDEAKKVAAEAAPGRVVEWEADHGPTGLRYDVTLLHDDGSTTEVEVDTATGQVLSIDHDSYWD